MEWHSNDSYVDVVFDSPPDWSVSDIFTRSPRGLVMMNALVINNTGYERRLFLQSFFRRLYINASRNWIKIIILFFFFLFSTRYFKIFFSLFCSNFPVIVSSRLWRWRHVYFPLPAPPSNGRKYFQGAKACLHSVCRLLLSDFMFTQCHASPRDTSELTNTPRGDRWTSLVIVIDTRGF